MNLVVALLLIAGLWIIIAHVLAVLTRTDLADLAEARLATKTAPWRPPPPNRILPTAPIVELR